MKEMHLLTNNGAIFYRGTARGGDADKIATRVVNISVIGRDCANVSCDRSLPSHDNDQQAYALTLIPQRVADLIYLPFVFFVCSLVNYLLLNISPFFNLFCLSFELSYLFSCWIFFLSFLFRLPFQSPLTPSTVLPFQLSHSFTHI